MAVIMASDQDGVSQLMGGPVGLLHSRGSTPRVARRGTACGNWLRIPAGHVNPADVDLLVVCPTRPERDVATAGARTARLDPKGLLLIEGSSQWPGSRSSHVHIAIGEPTQSLTTIFVSSGPVNGYFLPRRPRLVRFVLGALMNGLLWARRVASGAIGTPAVGRLAVRLFGRVGQITRTSTAPPLLSWLDQGHAPPEELVIRTKSKATGAAAIIHCFRCGSAIPHGVAKVPRGASHTAALMSESRALHILGPSARPAGVRVPTSALRMRPDVAPWLWLEHMAGRRESDALRSSRREPHTVMALLTDWLKSWNRATRTTRILTRDWLDTEVLAGARMLAPLVPASSDYLARLERIGASVVGSQIPLVAAHNDLTMQNVLWDLQAGTAVLDWEAARPDGLPMVDFTYAVVDAFHAADPRASRAAALVACFREGVHASWVTTLAMRLEQSLQLEPAFSVLCFHACWIHHAVSEASKGGKLKTLAFVEIVRRLAREPLGNRTEVG